MALAPDQLQARDPSFVARLKASEPARLAVAAYLDRQGFEVEIPEMTARPRADVRFEYSDDGDLFGTKGGSGRYRFEVKQRLKYTFGSREEYPRPDTIVGDCHRLRGPLHGVFYFIVNPEMTGALVVPCAKTKARWTRVRRYMEHVGRVQEFYTCPVALTEYRDLREASHGYC